MAVVEAVEEPSCADGGLELEAGLRKSTFVVGLFGQQFRCRNLKLNMARSIMSALLARHSRASLSREPRHHGHHRRHHQNYDTQVALRKAPMPKQTVKPVRRSVFDQEERAVSRSGSMSSAPRAPGNDWEQWEPERWMETGERYLFGEYEEVVSIPRADCNGRRLDSNPTVQRARTD